MSPEEEVVAFFLALPKARRREYDALAERDRRFGEDVEAERRGHDANSSGKGQSS